MEAVTHHSFLLSDETETGLQFGCLWCDGCTPKSRTPFRELSGWNLQPE